MLDTSFVKLSVIIVNWNSTSYLRRCLASIGEWADNVEHEIIVVDNASPDRDVDLLKNEFKDIILIQSVDNLGFARANNLGFRHSKGGYVLFLNPDTKLNGPAINVLLRRIESLPDAGVVGCRLLNGDLTLQETCIQTFPTILNQVLDAEVLRNRWRNSRLWGIAPLFSSSSEPAVVEVISGACMLLRREVFEKAGMFSEDYFMYAEDLDLCRKVKSAGYRNYYVGDASLIHYGGGSSSLEWATSAKWKAIVRYLVKHRGWLYASAFRTTMAAVAVCRLLLLAPVSALRRLCGVHQAPYSPMRKWVDILKTLVTYSGLEKCAMAQPPVRAAKDIAVTESSYTQGSLRP